MSDLQVHLPTPAECSVVFDQKQFGPCAPPSPFTQSHPKQLFLFPQVKKVLKGKHFADVEEVKQKNGTSTKRHQNR